MILTNSQSPRWIQELSRFMHVKSLLVLHGNVLDLVSFPVDDAQSGSIRWTHGDSLPGFLARFLRESGYEIVATVDPLDGLGFDQAEMRSRYEEIIGGSGNDVRSNSHSERERSRSGAAAPGGGPHASRTPNRGSNDDVATTMDRVGQVLANGQVPSAFVVNLASRLVSGPEHLSERELALFTRLLRASLNSREVIRSAGERWNNVLIMVCDKPNDLPAFLYVNNPRTRSICIDRPGRAERNRFFHATYRGFYGVGSGTSPSDDLAGQFAALTEGLSYYEMSNLVSLSRKEQISASPLEPLIERYKYGITTSEWDSDELKQRLRSANETIRDRVKGQDSAVARTLDIIKRARLGLAAGQRRQSQRPRGVLFFAGPTGVGKTEMAKALASLLFGDEDRLIRFDMSEYSAEHADQRLLGSPPGYVGYEEGGQLTSQVKENPFSVLLFDEIEKAHPRIFDKFLQVLDDGRLTDGKGETVYFAQCIIIFTSNLGTVARSEDDQAEAAVTPNMPYERVKEAIHDAISDHFYFELGRPEILNRFGDNFVIFDFIHSPLDEEIVDMLLTQFAQALVRQRGITLEVGDRARAALVALARNNLGQGGRGIRNVLDTALINPLARWLFDNDIDRDASLRLEDVTDRGNNAAYRYELEVTSPS